MKKTILACLAAICTIHSFAQPTSGNPEPDKSLVPDRFMPSKSMYSLEAHSNYVNNTFNSYYYGYSYSGYYYYSSANYTGIKCRYFITDTLALRLSLSGAAGSRPYVNDDTYRGQLKTNKSYYGQIQLSIGMERHWFTSKRLTPYLAADINLAYAKYKGEVETIDTTGFNTSGIYGYESTKTALFVPAISGSIGVDYYFGKHIYIGTEFSLGASIIKNYNKKIAGINKREAKDMPDVHQTDFNVSGIISAGIRFGFIL